MGRPQEHDIALLLVLWERDSFTREELVYYLAKKGVSKATVYRRFKEFLDSGLIEKQGKDTYAYTGVTPVSLIHDYAEQAASLVTEVHRALARAVYGPVAVAKTQASRRVSRADVEPVQRHIAATRQALLSLAGLLRRMEHADLTDPELTVILDNTEAVQRLTEIRKGFDQS